MPEPLVRPSTIEVVDILVEHAPQVAFSEDQEMIEALPPDAPEEALADGVGPRRARRRAQDPDAADRGYPSKIGPELAVVIADQEARRPPVGCRLA